MNTKFVTGLVLLMFIFSCRDLQKKPPILKTPNIIGTWKLNSYQYGERERQMMPNNIQKIKLITPTHFNWIQYDTKDRVVTNSAGGKYSFDGKNYIESIYFAGSEMISFIGKENKFLINVEGDTLYLSGQISDNLKIYEVWIKLE